MVVRSPCGVVRGLVVAVVLAGCAAALAEEQRCAELGAACLCSEPLDNDDVYAPMHDPSDSGAKGCGVLDATRGGIGTSHFPVAFPPGASARRVFAIVNDRGSNGKLLYRLPSSPLDLTGKTLCVRHYALYGPDHAPPGNIKIARVGHPDGMAWQASWSGGFDPDWIGSPQVAVVADPGGTGRTTADCNLPYAGDTSKIVEFDDCQERWCRFEICAEHDPATGEHMVRAQFVQVGGDRAQENRGNCGAPPSPTSRVVGKDMQVLEYTTTSPPDSAGGSRYLSHAMVAIQPYDPGFWIGAACEVEGGCGSGPAAPPEASPAPRAPDGDPISYPSTQPGRVRTAPPPTDEDSAGW